MSGAGRWRALWAIGVAWAKRFYMYRVNVMVSIMLAGVQIYLLTLVWRAAYGGRGAVDGVSLPQMLTYLTIANLQLLYLQNDLAMYLQTRVREGQIGFDIARPVSFLQQLIAMAVGQFIGAMPLLVVGIPVAFVFGELHPPATMVAGAGYVASLLVGWVVAVELNLLVGAIAFWTLESTGFMMMYRLISTFATGALIPFWFMPGAFAVFFRALPFQSMASIPVSIYIGNPAFGSITAGLAMQLGWAVVLGVGVRLVWRMALDHTVVQGG